MEHYQLIVVGAGPGGYVAAIRAAQLGLKTAIVEKDKFGGTCLNRGCIPTKSLLHSASTYAECAHFEELGLSAENVSYNIEKIHARKSEVSETLRNGVEQLLIANKVDIIKGTGVITANDTVTVDGIEYKTDKILIAAGSIPARPPIPGLTLPGIVTSDEILEGPVIDYKSIIIIGGGVIGVEFASIYAALGCKVTIVEALDRLLSNMDKEFAQSLNMILKRRGVEINCGSSVEKVEQSDDGLTVTFVKNEQKTSVTAQGVLVSIGRHPNTKDLFAQAATPEIERGFIKVNEKYESSIPGIYAVGDAIGGIQLAHKAEAEGMAVVEMMCGNVPVTDPHFVPSCIYTNPEISSVGITADEAKKSGKAVKTAKYIMSGNGKSIIDMQERGFIKVVVDEETDVLLGIQMMCGRATDLISEFTSAVANGMTCHQLLKGMRPHPSYCEGISEALEAVEGKSIHSSPVKK